MYMVVKLSLFTGIGNIEDTCNSKSSLVSQDDSVVTTLIDLYSPSVTDRVTVDCFLDFQEIGFPTNMIKYPLIGFLVIGH